MIVESSEIVFEGLSTILKDFDEKFVFKRVGCLKEASENLISDNFQIVIVNSIYFNSIKNGKYKISTIFNNQNIISLINTSFERSNCGDFMDCIYINDDKETIHSVIKKYLKPKSRNLEINNDALSEREIDVLKLLVRGYANKEIAEELFISTHTVITHRKNISKKIGMKSTAAMAIYAAANNIIDINTVLKDSK